MSKRKLPEVNKRIFPYDLVIAWWEDIVADSIWVSIPDIKKSTTAICCTVGWLMKQNDKVAERELDVDDLERRVEKAKGRWMKFMGNLEDEDAGNPDEFTVKT